MKRRLMGLGLMFFTVVNSNTARAEYHYTVADPFESSIQNFQFQPFDEADELFEATSKGLVDLLKFDEHRGALPDPDERYNRKEHFGTWVKQEDCHDTRAMVLIRESTAPVKFYPNNKCKVQSGKWLDVYSGKTLTKAYEVQIDHMIPLKNAYISGAWGWNNRARCLFANFLDNDFHLLPVSSFENQSKSDLTPESYMPSDESYACEYLKNWLRIKLIWKLGLSESETQAIRRLAKTYHCSAQDLQSSEDELSTTRHRIVETQDQCEIANY